jgi:hypothetical protein
VHLHLAVDVMAENALEVAVGVTGLDQASNTDGSRMIGMRLLTWVIGVIANRPSGSIGQRFKAVVLVAVQDLVASLAGAAERSAHLAHAPSSSRATNGRRSSITEFSFHGINASRKSEK